MKNNNVKHMCLAAVFAAVVFVTTAYLHIPSHTGYVHIGDGFIFLTACLLPTPYAVFAGVCGAVLSDCLTGFALWAPGSAVIKAVIALLFTCRGEKAVSVRNALMLIPAAIINIGGYYLYEALITSNFIVPLYGIPGSVTQSVLSSIVFVALGLALDKLNVKKSFLNGGK